MSYLKIYYLLHCTNINNKHVMKSILQLKQFLNHWMFEKHCFYSF